MTPSSQDPSHRRSATRAPVGRPIRLQFDDSLEVIEGLCRNVSIGGMFISFGDSRPAGSLVRFELELEDSSAIRGLGEVVWMKSKNDFGEAESGFGLKFRFLEQRDRQMIFKLVSQHIKDRLSKREPEAGEGFGRGAPPPPAAAALGIAIPPEPRVPRPAPRLPERELAEDPEPAGFDLPFELESPPPEELLPALEDFRSIEKEPFETGPRPASPVGRDPVDLDPAAGSTPSFELDVGSEPPSSGRGDFDLLSGPGEVPAAAGGEIAGEPAGFGDVASDERAGDDAGRQWQGSDAREEIFTQPASRPRRLPSWLPVIAVLLVFAALIAYLFQDEVIAWLDGGSSPAVAARSQDADRSAGGSEAPGAATAAAAEAPAAEPAAADPSPAAEGSAPVPAAGARAVDVSAETSPAPQVDSSPAAVVPPAAEPPPAALPRPSPAASSAGFTHLVDVAWSEISGGLKITLAADGQIPSGRFRYFRMSGGAPREVVKLIGVDRPFPRSEIRVGGRGVERIRLGFHRAAGGDEIHVVVDLADPRWRVTEVVNIDSGLELTLTGP